jgi:hypothetical protein
MPWLAILGNQVQFPMTHSSGYVLQRFDPLSIVGEEAETMFLTADITPIR